jgi:16S rRNA G1207 methylase RsmC
LSEDKSLRAWSAADEYLFHTYNELEQKPNQLAIYHDRFGYLSCYLNTEKPKVILTHNSQKNAIVSNCKANQVNAPEFCFPLEQVDEKIDFVLLKIPKSLGLFQLYLEHIVANSTEDVTVVCAFMTRHFASGILEVASQYFEEVEQSRALKKARLVILKKKKGSGSTGLIASVNYKERDYKQYLGVFSAKHIDYATQFFLNHIHIEDTDQRILDLASGNGIIGNEIYLRHPHLEVHLMDDSYLAVESAKMNIQGSQIHHHLNHDLRGFEGEFFDSIVSNPPFHFEHEINIQIPLYLFKECYRCLKVGGDLQLVANRHLNYKVHLVKIFKHIEITAEDSKFVVYKCLK